MKFLHALPIAIGFSIHSAAAIGVDEQPHQPQHHAAAAIGVGVDERPYQPQQQQQATSSLTGLGQSIKKRSKKRGGCVESRDLEEFPQWREEVGYWIGDLTFYGSEGAPFESTNWNYPYNNYTGFITGNISGGSYRQRNVFLYPPQTEEACQEDGSVAGNGTCGTNGNSKLFEADQSISPDVRSCDGTIEGPFAGIFDTKTTLVGEDNALLYQVFYQGAIFQSQLTTLSGNGRRTRSAHGYNPFGPTPEVPTYCSFYRERRVEREEFYAALETTLDEYGILDDDACTRDSNGNLVDGIVGGFDACEAHLEESFEGMFE